MLIFGGIIILICCLFVFFLSFKENQKTHRTKHEFEYNVQMAKIILMQQQEQQHMAMINQNENNETLNVVANANELR